MILVAICLAILGAIFGSFVNALVWRVHEKKDWVRARSQCIYCNHLLAAKDLVPLFSWLLLRGRCRYCQKPISMQYPIVELATALTFVLSYVFWPQDLHHAANLVLFVSWLAASVGLMALLVYDYKWMLLPNKLIYPALLIATAGRLSFILLEPHKLHALLNWGGAILIASGLFFLLFYGSRGKWIGFGDVRLGIVLGTLVGTANLALFLIFVASILGTIVALPALIANKKNLSSRIPFGPFLITATLVTVLFGQSLLDWYKNMFLN